MPSLRRTFVKPFVVVHSTHVLVHRAHALKNAELHYWFVDCTNISLNN